MDLPFLVNVFWSMSWRYTRIFIVSPSSFIIRPFTQKLYFRRLPKFDHSLTIVLPFNASRRNIFIFHTCYDKTMVREWSNLVIYENINFASTVYCAICSPHARCWMSSYESTPNVVIRQRSVTIGSVIHRAVVGIMSTITRWVPSPMRCNDGSSAIEYQCEGTNW